MRCGMAAFVNARLPRVNCTGDSEKVMNDVTLEQLITAAQLLRPLLGERVFVGGSVTVSLLLTRRLALHVPPLMWMQSPRLPPTRSTLRLGNVCANWDSRKT